MGGSATVARKILAAFEGKSVEAIPPKIPLDTLRSLFHKVAEINAQQRQKDFGLSPGRADIFPVALLTLITLVEYAEKDYLLHSFCNLRYGLAAQLLAE